MPSCKAQQGTDDATWCFCSVIGFYVIGEKIKSTAQLSNKESWKGKTP